MLFHVAAIPSDRLTTLNEWMGSHIDFLGRTTSMTHYFKSNYRVILIEIDIGSLQHEDLRSFHNFHRIYIRQCLCSVLDMRLPADGNVKISDKDNSIEN